LSVAHHICVVADTQNAFNTLRIFNQAERKDWKFVKRRARKYFLMHHPDKRAEGSDQEFIKYHTALSILDGHFTRHGLKESSFDPETGKPIIRNLAEWQRVSIYI
jgi:hypothetical protein